MKTITIYVLIMICPPFFTTRSHCMKYGSIWFGRLPFANFAWKKRTVIHFFSFHDYLFFLFLLFFFAKIVLGCDYWTISARKISFQWALEMRMSWWIFQLHVKFNELGEWKSNRFFKQNGFCIISIVGTDTHTHTLASHDRRCENRKVKWNWFSESFLQNIWNEICCGYFFFFFFFFSSLKCQSNPHRLRFTWKTLLASALQLSKQTNQPNTHTKKKKK